MKKYDVVIMSIDPSEDEEDNHQKYGTTVEADDKNEAKTKGEQWFSDEHSGLPIYWIQVSESRT